MTPKERAIDCAARFGGGDVWSKATEEIERAITDAIQEEHERCYAIAVEAATQAINTAIEQEREICARIVDSYYDQLTNKLATLFAELFAHPSLSGLAKELPRGFALCAEEIRARGKA